MIATRSTRPAPRRAASALLVAALLTGCGGGAPARPEPRGARIAFRTDRGVVRTGPLWVARTPEERARGLMGVRRLPGDGGMAFLFERPTRGPFWMKDTPLPLSIAFWDRAGRVVAILDMEPCRSDPCPLYRPGVAYVGAVEMRQGWFEEHGVEVGDAVELQLEGT